MSDSALPSDRASVCAQLLRRQDRAIQLIQQALAEVDTPITRSLLSRLRADSSGAVEAAAGEATGKVEHAIRSLEYFQSETRKELIEARGKPPEEGREELPPAMARFLAERESAPGFAFESVRDPIRGWIIKWKQETAEGTVRGAGQLCERPYAWLEE